MVGTMGLARDAGPVTQLPREACMPFLLQRALPAGLAACAIALVAPAASADPAGDKVLAAVDAALNRAKTQYFEYEATNQEPGKAERKLGMNVWIKGEKQLTELTAPADMKGTKVLVLSPTQMYVYLPAFGKVRRIASSVSDQGCLGRAFSQDDLATTAYGPAYTAVIASETATEWKLTATPKAGQVTPYAKIELTISKDKSLPTQLELFDAGGAHVKTETRTGYTCQGDACTPGERKMVDHKKAGLWTKLIRKTWKVNESMSDDLFSKRNLEK